MTRLPPDAACGTCAYMSRGHCLAAPGGNLRGGPGWRAGEPSPPTVVHNDPPCVEWRQRQLTAQQADAVRLAVKRALGRS